MKQIKFIIYAFIFSVTFLSCTNDDNLQEVDDNLAVINRASIRSLQFYAGEKQFVKIENQTIGTETSGYNLDKEFSIEVIMNQKKIDNGRNYHILFSLMDRNFDGIFGRRNGMYSFVKENGSIWFVYTNNNMYNYIYTEKGVINSEKCYHISFVKKVDGFIIYVNGINVTAGINNHPDDVDINGNTNWNHPGYIYEEDTFKVLNNLPLHIGVFYNNLSNNYENSYYNGRVDDFRIWDSYLSQSFIEEHLFTDIDSGQDHLIAYYKFENEGQIVKDFTNNENDGYLGINPEDSEFDPIRVGEQCY